MLHPYTDIELVSGLKENNSKAFKQLFEQYYVSLVLFARKFIPTKDESEDIVIDVFQKCWQLRDNFDTMSAIKSFLYVSVRNACLNVLKQQRRRAEHDKDLAYLYETVTEEEQQNEIYEAELIRKVYNAIENLPEKCRLVFKMSYIEGQKTEDIASTLKITPSTVFNQKARALKLLKLSLSDKQFLAALIFFKIL